MAVKCGLDAEPDRRRLDGAFSQQPSRSTPLDWRWACLSSTSISQGQSYWIFVDAHLWQRLADRLQRRRPNGGVDCRVKDLSQSNPTICLDLNLFKLRMDDFAKANLKGSSSSVARWLEFPKCNSHVASFHQSLSIVEIGRQRLIQRTCTLSANISQVNCWTLALAEFR